MNLFYKRLKKLRKDAGFTQKELGYKLNLTKVSICNYEKGNRMASIETLIDISNLFKVDLNYLIGTEIVVIDDKKNISKVSCEEIELIKELRKNIELFDMFTNNPKRTINLIKRKIL